MCIEILPLSDNMGAEVRGVDLSRPVERKTADLLQDAFIRHILLLFRGQTFPDERTLLNSAAWLGSNAHITMPGNKFGDDGKYIHLISNIRDETGAPIGDLGASDLLYHHDNSFTNAPDMATYLFAVELPSTGGITLFSNCYKAYEALPDHLLKAIAGRRVLQVYDYNVNERPSKERLAQMPSAWQPTIVVHPVTSGKVLYVNPLNSMAIEGYGEAESDRLLEELFPYIERVDYALEWRIGDYIIFDNRCSAHARTEFPADQRRLLKRGKVAGNPMIAAVVA
ncbi:MAG: TauD/TfdA family dioxygenase [Proteobacteria bacterium]|nr:TauD/TfdA family dioxygenase [Pseudomonadota bacterium]